MQIHITLSSVSRGSPTLGAKRHAKKMAVGFVCIYIFIFLAAAFEEVDLTKTNEVGSHNVHLEFQCFFFLSLSARLALC